MKRYATLFISMVLLCAFASPMFVGINTASAQTPKELRIANWYEYMAGDAAEGIPELLQAFEEEYDVTVVYDRFDTNEMLYNNMNMNKKGDTYSYDLVCPSDYMIQKMIREDMLEKIADISTNIPNYVNHASPYIQELFEDSGVSDYAVGYMWGTLGFAYDGNAVAASDMRSWSALWNIDYKGKSTLKDSIRDTYFLGLAYVQRDELNALADIYEAESARINALREVYDANDQVLIDAETAYNEYVSEYADTLKSMLNDTSAPMVAKVEAALKSVSGNIFGYEVDTGKEDITTGKITINFAWSGDAVTIIDEADEDGNDFYYTVPREGSNVWFDGWVMPKGADKELAYKFMDFISRPENAIENMEYIGYTSVISGANNEIYDWMLEQYDLSEEPFDGAVRADLTYFFAGRNAVQKVYVYTDTTDKQFNTQYPDVSVIHRSAVMLDFDDQALARISQMWVRLRANVLPTWAIVLIVAGSVAIVGAVLTFVLVKRNGGGPRGKKPKKGWTVVKTENT